jgi:hypothetical protein
MDSHWIRPRAGDDIQDAEEVQILPVTITGDWEFTQEKPTFVVSNTKEVQQTFSRICSELSF